jgi:hypothetical protein
MAWATFRAIILKTHLVTLITVLPIHKYHCTAHYSSVSFWTRNRLDQIKVIARAHPCHHFHTYIHTIKVILTPNALICAYYFFICTQSYDGELQRQRC